MTNHSQHLDPLTIIKQLPNVHFSDELQRALSEIAAINCYEDSEIIMHEGEVSDELFIIAQGQVDVFRPAHAHQEEQLVATLGELELIGELALIDGAPRSMSIKAKGRCHLLKICPDKLAQQPNGERLLVDLKVKLGTTVVQRMRLLSQNYATALEKQIDTLKEQKVFGQFFLYTISILTIGMLVNNAIARHIVTIDIYALESVLMFSLILVLPTILVLWKMKIPFNQMGLTRKNLRVSVIEGLIASAIIFVVIGILGTVLSYFDKLPGKVLPFDPLGSLVYLFYSFLQELIARGFLQSSFQRFLNDEKGIKSVVITSILFGVSHLHFGLHAVLITMISGFMFGAFYLRHHNIAGVTLLHYFAGAAAFTFGLL